MVYALYKSIFAMIAAIAVGSTEGVGVCYAPWHHATISADVITADFKLIMTSFTSIRLYETQLGNYNAIELAAAAGAKITAGVQMNNLAGVDAEIKAVCKGYQEHPEAVIGIWVGNENLKNNGFGTVSADQLIAYIQEVKTCTGGKVPVGTAQRINEWLSADGADRVFAACDKIGANIYPFFTPGSMSPLEKLEAQWAQLAAKYDMSKAEIGETGYPSTGGSNAGNDASLTIAQEYLNKFIIWTETHIGENYWFMFADTTVSYTGQEYEKHFGVYNSDGTPKLTVPSKSGSPTNTTNGAPVPRYAVDVPITRNATTPSPQYAVGVPLVRTPEAQTGGSPSTGGPPSTPTEQTPGKGAFPPSTPVVQAGGPSSTPTEQTPGTEATPPSTSADTPPMPSGDSSKHKHSKAHAPSGKDCPM